MTCNNDRAEWALEAVDTFTRTTMFKPAGQALKEEGERAVLGDLLCNLRHLCHQNGYDFAAICEGSREVFEEELQEELEDGGGGL